MKHQYYAKTAESVTQLARRIMDASLCKEIILMSQQMTTLNTIKIERANKSKYKFSRANWYVADFDPKDYFEVDEWCAEQFGPHPKRPDAWSRWVHRYETSIHFRDLKDYQWFVLRWGA